MALESWDGLRLGLMALGYRSIIWTHLHCVACGVFKLAVSEEMDKYPCPECDAACKVNFIAQGFTRYELPAPEKICKPLSTRTRYELLLPERPPRKQKRKFTDGPRGLKLPRLAIVDGD